MNRLATILALVLASSVVACAAEGADESDTTPTTAQDAPASDLEAKPHSAPAATNESAATQEEGSFAVERIGGRHAIPTPTPKPGF